MTEPSKHPRTHAATTTTNLTTTTKPPTVAQKQAELSQALTPKPLAPKAPVSTVIDPTARTVNLAKLEQLLERPYTDFSFHGIDGDYPSVGGDKIPTGSKFVGIVAGGSHGFIKFNGEGEVPTIRETFLSDDAPVITREELGDLDESKWEPGLDGQPRDPWQEQICLPVVPQDASGEVFRFVARSATALRAVRRLLGAVRYHPNGKLGWLPVIQFGVAIYHNKTRHAEAAAQCRRLASARGAGDATTNTCGRHER
jgi:hypothetical protein